MKKLMALTGAGKAALELWEEAGATRARLRPAAQGDVWLCSGDGRLFRVDGEGLCPFDPAGALVAREGRIVLSGGFAGRRGLLDKARRTLSQSAGPERKPAAQPQPQPQPQPQSRTAADILRRAEELFSPIGDAPAPPPAPADQPALNPFPEAFPLSRWRRVAYPGTDRHYLEGELYKNGVTYLIHALPGEYRPARRPRGFDRYLRGRDGAGYWVRITAKKH